MNPAVRYHVRSMADEKPPSKGRGRGRGGRPGGGRPGGAGGGGGQGRGPGGPNRGGGSGGRGRRDGQQQQTPLEIAARSSRNALKRHAESVRDDQSKLACRSLLTALHGATDGVSSPAELLGVVEQVAHVLEAGRREDSQLPVALRAVVAFALDTPRRSRDVAEMLRLLLRHGYCLASDHIPRQLRDDGEFRASALWNVVEDVSREYLDDKAFAEITA